MKFEDKLIVQQAIRKISNIELANRTGFHPVTISKMRNGKTIPSIKDVEKIAKALGCEKSDLWPDDEEEIAA